MLIMTTEEKQLLLKDLCARLPYGVKCQFEDSIRVIDGESSPFYDYTLSVHHLNIFMRSNNFHIKPYLRPMSSMTEEERAEMKAITCPNGTGYFQEQYLVCPMNHFGNQISFDFMADIIDWLNAHHFDFRGLIENGLALEAPEGMYKNF